MEIYPDINVFWYVHPCGVVDKCWCFGGTYSACMFRV